MNKRNTIGRVVLVGQYPKTTIVFFRNTNTIKRAIAAVVRSVSALFKSSEKTWK